MKKLFSLLLALLFCLSFASCDKEEPNHTTPLDTTTDPPLGTTEAPKPTDTTIAKLPPHTAEAVTQAILRVDYWDDKTDSLWPEGDILNRDTFIFSDKKHLAVYRCDSTAELAAFKETYGDFLDCMWSPRENGTEFDEVTAGCDEDFFEESTLLLTHWTATSGSYSFKLKGITRDDGTVTVHVMQERLQSDMMTADMASWLAIMPVKRSDLPEHAKFDAVLSQEKDFETEFAPVGTPHITWVNYADSLGYWSAADNANKRHTSDERCLPIYVLESTEELAKFDTNVGAYFDLNGSYNGTIPFRTMAKNFDESFFEENMLLLVYVDANSGSLRFDVDRLTLSEDGNTIYVYIKQTNHPEEVTDDMAGWLAVITIRKADLPEGMTFNAAMG